MPSRHGDRRWPWHLQSRQVALMTTFCCNTSNAFSFVWSNGCFCVNQKSDSTASSHARSGDNMEQGSDTIVASAIRALLFVFSSVSEWPHNGRLLLSPWLSYLQMNEEQQHIYKQAYEERQAASCHCDDDCRWHILKFINTEFEAVRQTDQNTFWLLNRATRLLRSIDRVHRDWHLTSVAGRRLVFLCWPWRTSGALHVLVSLFHHFHTTTTMCVLMICIWVLFCHEKRWFRNMEESHITHHRCLRGIPTLTRQCLNVMRWRNGNERAVMRRTRLFGAAAFRVSDEECNKWRLLSLVPSSLDPTSRKTTMIPYPILFYDVKHGHGDGEEGLPWWSDEAIHENVRAVAVPRGRAVTIVPNDPLVLDVTIQHDWFIPLWS